MTENSQEHDESTPPVLSYHAAVSHPPKPPIGVWSDDDLVVAVHGAKWPRRCCICGAPTNRKLKKIHLKWIPDKAARSLILGQLYARVTADTILIRYGYCHEHARWFTPQLGTRLCSLAGIAMFFGTCFFIRGKEAALLGLGLTTAFILAGIVFSCIPFRIRIVKYSPASAWLRGFEEGYRSFLPSLQEAQEQQKRDAADALEQVREESNDTGIFTENSDPEETTIADQG
jgi:hypothetical protein